MKKNLINLAFGAVLAIPLLVGTAFVSSPYVPLGSFEVYADEEYEFMIDGIKYSVTEENENEYECGVIIGGEYTGDITIPETVSYNGKIYKVTSIEGSAFIGCKELTSISMPYVKKISATAFAECRNLTSVDMPMVQTILGSAFVSCTNLSNLNMPNAVTIEGTAFAGCQSLKNLSIPNVKYIAEQAFIACESLQSVSMPKLQSIGAEAFVGCVKLKRVFMGYPDTIGTNIFSNCEDLEILAISSNISEDDNISSNYIDNEFITSMNFPNDNYMILTDCDISGDVNAKNVVKTIAETERPIYDENDVLDETRTYCFDFDGNIYLIYHTKSLLENEISLLYNDKALSGTKTSTVFKAVQFPDESMIEGKNESVEGNDNEESTEIIEEEYLYAVQIKNANGYIPVDKFNFG